MTSDHPPSSTAAAVTITNDSAVTCNEQTLVDLVHFLLPRIGLHPDCEVGITLVDADRMADLHIEWMDEPGPTDVLSFPMDELRSAAEGEDPIAGVLGDIVLCPEFVAVQAAERGRTLDAELEFLVTHGMLHLIGHDHATPEDYDVMFALQDELLGEWSAR